MNHSLKLKPRKAGSSRHKQPFAMATLTIVLTGLFPHLGRAAPISTAALANDIAQFQVVARSKGEVRVIAEFTGGVGVPQNGLMAQTTRAERRELVKRGRSALLATLPASSYGVARKFRNIPFVSLVVRESALEALANNPQLISLEPDRLHRPIMASANSVIGSSVAWEAGWDGAGKVIAVLDTGIDAGHPYFNDAQKIAAEACFSTSGNAPFSVSACPGGQESTTGEGAAPPCTTLGCDHGTHVAGIAAGRDPQDTNHGVAPGAGLIAIQVFSDFFDSSICNPQASCALSYTSDQIAGLEHVLSLTESMDIVAVNMSLGDGSNYNGFCDQQNSAFKAVVDQLKTANVATVVASGNDGYRTGISSPACVSSVVSVGATTDFDQVASFSNVSEFVSLMAPGVNITSATLGDGISTGNGTSFSAPIVAGAWALMAERSPGISADQTLIDLQKSAVIINDNRAGGTQASLERLSIRRALGEIEEPREVAGAFVPVEACRLLDTREDDNAWYAGQIYDINTHNLPGRNLVLNPGAREGCAVPDGASAAHFSITVLGGTTAGYARAWPAGNDEPLATVMAWAKARYASNALTLPLCSGDLCDNGISIKLYSDVVAPVNVVVDLLGFYTSGTP
jgi:subtilisin